MTGAPQPSSVRFADLGPRLASGVAMALLAGALVAAGPAPAAGLGALALGLMLWEYQRMVTMDTRLTSPTLVAMAVAGLASVLAALAAGPAAALACLAVGAAVVIALGRGWAAWLAGGLLYIGGGVCALVVLRARAPEGLQVILWLVLVVIAVDVAGFSVGRTVGGAKLWPRVSPGKTWSGAAGALAAAGVVGFGFALAAGLAPVRALVLSLGVGVAAQLGDLLESAVKRRFAVKDSSRLIPGHGGVMDRLDGLLGGAWFYVLGDACGFSVAGP